MPKSTLALVDPKFAVMMSSLPSPFTSPKVKERGFVPASNTCWLLKVPLPLPMSTAMAVFVFAVTMSSFPSPFKSPKAMAN